jgi:hypothetical protein
VSCDSPGTAAVDEVSSVGWTIGTGGPGGTPVLFAPLELALLPELFLLELLLLELLLAELLALRELLGRPADDAAGAFDEGPAALSLELFVVDVVDVVPVAGVVVVVDEGVFPFCAQGGRFGSSCARMGSIVADTSRNAPSSGRKCNILRWEA